MNKNVMVAAENLGVFADSVIMSIGAVKFNLETGEIGNDPFYVSISIDSNTAQGRRISEDTLIERMGLPKETQTVFYEPKIILPSALEELSDWVGNDNECQVWSDSNPDIIPMLAHAFHFNDMHAPWRLYNTCCYGTMKNLPCAAKAPKPLLHDALQIALFQAHHLISIYQSMSPVMLQAA